MNVLADIVSTINDHSAGNFTPSHVPRTTNILVNAEEFYSVREDGSLQYPDKS
ncbi:hypothetical protein DAPPUDRAFT_246870 [Daphnia pulex]|uniref:Uncharacterized protein n=1 Tax=Daphnia pulex TaxID=6669 RepID=E9GRC5_DAPPU|nr:hypothetical protein DAPPUDRAFT_246870 [Daphnia pulex]|eukprot:EFX77990.1 hypothetical protein DAPPUDRAFT_246870 [Daphnia pulex]